MKFLQKILFVVMIGLFVGNVNVRGLQFSDPRGAAAPDHVVVNAGGTLPGLAAGAVAPQVGDNYIGFDINAAHDRIYFPATGIQPTANLVRRLARAEDGVNTAITRWYVDAFGGRDAIEVVWGVAVHLEMGRTVGAPPMPAQVISVHAAVPPNFARDFWRKFRVIASTPEGRELLYKILIEIRRIDTGHANRHCYASGAERVGGMSLTVTHAANAAFINKENITFNQVHANRLQSVLEQYYRFLTTLVTLPANTPNANENEINVPNAAIVNDQFTRIQIGGNNMYFPINEHQPTTPNAALWSCANVNGVAGNTITNWYIEAFGGADGLAASVGDGVLAPVAINLPPMGFKNNAPHLVITHTPYTWGQSIKKPCRFVYTPEMRRFWQAFRSIAENPIGRVLLYRILIEIRRQNSGNGSCENGIVPGNRTLMRRNLCRSVEIKYNIDNGSFFGGASVRTLGFDPNELGSITLRIMPGIAGARQLDTHQDPDNDSMDIGIFHEMLHWLHYLRHPQRYRNSDNADPTVYRYLLRSYYGDHHGISELYTWGEAIDDEEFRTILGAPNYTVGAHLAMMDYNGTFLRDDPGGGIDVNAVGRYIPFDDRFLEGDDLSENVYRMARERNVALAGAPPTMAKHKMRFGHGREISSIAMPIGAGIPNRFRLAHLVATDCYNAIMGHAVVNWDLISGEAAQ